ncbi:MAG: DUF2156 domain-containing protein [Candidatus Nomurabacteria bacterium]|nr:DUF2156 domain-containing protein [Candidatus Nomurabacteria bacterium]USN87914.1 MAG: DUF2156 domain-containing protein [Candidatus Nomurabacteria bacterium]
MSDKPEIDSYTNRYKPYSDFNFTSLWSWSINNERQVSVLNGNLVVYFTDYETNYPFLSFLGTNSTENTIVALINWAKAEGLSSTLSLVPQEVVDQLPVDTEFLIEEDIDNFDYIFDVSELSYLEGRKYKTKKHLSRIFLNNNPDAVFEVFRYDDIGDVNRLLLLVEDWEKNKISNGKSDAKLQEKIGLKRLVDTLRRDENIVISTLTLDGKIRAFSIDEILVAGYATSHFVKADITYRGIYEFMNEKIAEYLHKNSVVYWNWEQDLGVKGLRSNKLSYRPVDFLKKYKIMQT